MNYFWNYCIMQCSRNTGVLTVTMSDGSDLTGNMFGSRMESYRNTVVIQYIVIDEALKRIGVSNGTCPLML